MTVRKPKDGGIGYAPGTPPRGWIDNQIVCRKCAGVVVSGDTCECGRIKLEIQPNGNKIVSSAEVVLIPGFDWTENPGG